MRYLVTGTTGQLGREVAQLLRGTDTNNSILTPGRSVMDLSNPEAVGVALNRLSPDVIINCAAWTAVDAAELNPDAARTVNFESPQVMARYCSMTGASLMQVSTDYVFSGLSEFGYEEFDPVQPASVYGQTKAEAEIAIAEALPDRHAIVRTAWLYGTSRDNFPCKILRSLHAQELVRVVIDETGSPSWSRDVARRMVELLMWWRSSRGPIGVVHAVNSGSATRFAFAEALAVYEGLDVSRIHPTAAASLDLAIPRPAHSQLLDTRCSSSFGLPPMRPWRDALREALTELAPIWLNDDDMGPVAS